MAWSHGISRGEAALRFVQIYDSNGDRGGDLETRRQENCGSLYDYRSFSFLSP